MLVLGDLELIQNDANNHAHGNNRMDDNRLAKIAKNGEPNTAGHLDGVQNIAAKVGCQHHRRTGALDKIQDMVSEKEKEGEEDQRDLSGMSSLQLLIFSDVLRSIPYGTVRCSELR